VNILVIDNGTIRTTEIGKLLVNHSLQFITPALIDDKKVSQADLILLTGSSLYSVDGNEEFFGNEINLIKEAKKPLIGICLGFQLIAFAFGLSLKKKVEKIEGFKQIRFVKKNIYLPVQKYTVYEGHSWVVEEIKDPLIGYAKSTDGWEVLKHKNKQLFGLQFHPEMANKEHQDGKNIFEAIMASIRLD